MIISFSIKKRKNYQIFIKYFKNKDTFKEFLNKLPACLHIQTTTTEIYLVMKKIPVNFPQNFRRIFL